MVESSISVLRGVRHVAICSLIAVTFCWQSAKADIISTETVTGFANTVAGPPAAFSISLTGLGTDALADGTLELITFGDFSNAFEYIDVSIEGVSLGRLWDNDTSNDSFVGNVFDNDRGSEHNRVVSGEIVNSSAVAQLSESLLDQFLADGVLVVSFDAFGAQVDNLQDVPDEFITATVTLNDATVAIPEPTFGLMIVLAGACGLITRRR